MDVAPEYVVARRVLLDALAALESHVPNLVLVGAQAVYHHTGDTDLRIPLFTTDADLAIDAHSLEDSPELGDVLRAAGFSPGTNPGHWVDARQVAVDLMVVPHQSGRAKASARAAHMPPHDKATARVARGLEPALIDHETVTMTTLEPGDGRRVDLKVAGPGALLTAKAIKIGERLKQAAAQPGRVREKDALDAFRILQAVETDVLVRSFASHSADQHARAVTAEAIEIYRAEASTVDGRIAQLAATAAHGDRTVAPSFAALVTELLDEL